MNSIIKFTSSILLILLINSCNNMGDKNKSQAHDRNDMATSWNLEFDTTNFKKPLGLFLTLKSNKITLERTGEIESKKIFHECRLEFDCIRPIDLKALDNKIEKARKGIPTEIESINEVGIEDALMKNYALLELIILDSTKKIIENSSLLSISFDTLSNLTYGHGKIKFQFKSTVTDAETKRIIKSEPKYFRVNLSDKSTGLSKVYGDYIKSIKK